MFNTRIPIIIDPHFGISNLFCFTTTGREFLIVQLDKIDNDPMV